MTDARFPERYLVDRRVQRLSDSSYRAWSTMTLWSVANRTDGVIEVADLVLIPHATIAATEDLIAAELLTARDDESWTLTDFEATQTSRTELEVLENARRREREKKQRQRAKLAEEGTGPGDVPGDVSPGTSQAGLGRTSTKEGTSPFCDKHPNGSDGKPCGGCADRRRAWEARRELKTSRPTPTPPRRGEQPTCGIHDYPFEPDGTCVACKRESEAA